MDTGKIIALAKKTIEIEIDTLENLLKEIENDFAEIVRLIFKSRGRLVITGIGKSAIVGQKIVATLNSTGTPALFMHAADAIHGDLGMIRQDDIVLCLSKSGETSEIKMLVPLVRKFGNTLIAMVSNRGSYLAKQADLLMITPIDKEADPNNLAPTASTTAQMALGDALAMALLGLRGFSSGDFAQYHPGGALGKQLYLTVADLYIKNPSPAVDQNTSIRGIIMEITSKRLGATAVLSADGKVEGIITDGDLRRMLESSLNLESLTARDIMNESPRSIEPNELAIESFNKMRELSISQLLVIEDGKYLGMIHIHDLIREGFI